MFAALIARHARRKRRIILSSEGYLALSYFPTLSKKRHVLWEKKRIYWT